MKKNKVAALDEANAAVLVEIATAETTSEPLRMQVYEELLSTKKGQDYFKTIFEEVLTLGECPHCKHKNHWGIPEDILNQMGWVTYKEDQRVNRYTNADTCEQFKQACAKKKVTI